MACRVAFRRKPEGPTWGVQIAPDNFEWAARANEFVIPQRSLKSFLGVLHSGMYVFAIVAEKGMAPVWASCHGP